MKDDIIVNPIAESCLTDSFDERVEKNKLVKEMDKGLRSHVIAINKQSKRVDELKNTVDILTLSSTEQDDAIKELKEECSVLRARSESARYAIEFIHELIDNELRALKWFSMIMCILFFLMLVVNLISQFGR
jgi:predicted RNase H-like nuclease (RuvC/YqgF family)